MVDYTTTTNGFSFALGEGYSLTFSPLSPIDRRLKRVRKEKMKLAERLVLKMDHVGDRIVEEDDALFSLTSVNNLVALTGDTSVTGADQLALQEQAEERRQLVRRRADERRSAIMGSRQTPYERRGDLDQVFKDTVDPEQAAALGLCVVVIGHASFHMHSS